MGIRLLALLALGIIASQLPGCSRGPAHPTDGDDALAFVVKLDNRHVRADAVSTITAHVEVRLRDEAPGERPSVNLALVIDTSGSMQGAAIDAARQAATTMIDALHDGDRLALIVFHSQPEVLLASAPIDDEQRALAHSRIAGMTARGTTDMAGGLASAIDEVARHHDPNDINRIVLLGDGIPNEAPRVRELAQSAGQQNITVTAFGLGDEYDETLMGAVAQLSGGRFHYVEKPAEMLAFFKQEALRLDRVVARNVRLELTPGPGVTIALVVGQQMSRHGPRGEVALGDMSLGEARDLLVRLETAPHKAGANVELIDARLRFDDPRGGAGRERHAYLGAIATSETAALEQGRDREVERLAARISAAAETVGAIEQARHGDTAAARARLARATAEAERAARAGSDAELAAQAASMRKLGDAFGDDPHTSAESPATLPEAEAARHGQSPSPTRPHAPRRGAPKAPSAPVVAAPDAPAPAEAAADSPEKKQRIRSVHDEAMQLLQ